MQVLGNKKQAKIIASKRIIAFDLDGTLTESKSDIDSEMSDLLCRLLANKIVAVMGGGNWDQFQNQFLRYLQCGKNQFKNFLLLPTSGASLYKLQGGNWKKIYQNKFSAKEKVKIFKAFEKAFRDIKYVKPKKKYGKVIEDRESQITFSALGQKAPLVEKEKWNKANNDIRLRLKSALETYLPEFEVRIGGLTSIDITNRGIDKAYGIEQLLKIYHFYKNDIVYIGDALYEGGNDEAVFKAEVATIGVLGPRETKHLIRRLLADL